MRNIIFQVFFFVITLFYKIKSHQLFHHLRYSLLKSEKIRFKIKDLEILEFQFHQFVQWSWVLKSPITVRFHSGKSIHTLKKEYYGNLFLTHVRNCFHFRLKKWSKILYLLKMGRKLNSLLRFCRHWDKTGGTKGMGDT